MSYANVLPEFSYANFKQVANLDITGLHGLLDRSNDKPLFIGIEEAKETPADFARNLEVYTEIKVRKLYFVNLVHAMERAEVPDNSEDIANFVMHYESEASSSSTSIIVNFLEDIGVSINNAMIRKAHDILNLDSE